MSVPFGRNTITVIESIETRDSGGKSHVSYQFNTLYGCSWNASKSLKTGSNDHDKEVTVSCRIPSDGQRCPCVGDVMILGAVHGNPITAKDVQDMIDEHRHKGAFRVTRVRDNSMAGYPLSHYHVEGE